MRDVADPTAHLVHDVLAWWLRNGPDRDHGGVLTCWDNGGERLLSTDKYTWSQGRWIWLLARVAEAVEAGRLPAQDVLDSAELRGLARRSVEFVRAHAVLPDLTTAYVTDRAGTPYEPTPGAGLHTSLFADCFVALGLAAWARIGPDVDAGTLAVALLDSAAERVRAGVAKTDPYPIHPDFTALSLPMILVGTATEVHLGTTSPRAAAIAVEAAGTIASVLRAGPDGADLVELRPRVDGLDDTLLARHRTPGHVLECLWFLLHAADAVPGVAAALGPDPGWLPAAALHALELGWDDSHGGLFRYADAGGGEPRGRTLADPYERLVQETWDTKLWWPHAEALYTTALLARRFPDSESRLTEWHQRLHDYTYATFPSGPGREWVQIRDRDGTPLSRTVALPVKDPFHIARALLLQVELIGRKPDEDR